jgi:anti-sigma-K factor RskA
MTDDLWMTVSQVRHMRMYMKTMLLWHLEEKSFHYSLGLIRISSAHIGGICRFQLQIVFLSNPHTDQQMD